MTTKRQLITQRQAASVVLSVKAFLIAALLSILLQLEALAVNPPTLSVTTGVYSSPTKTTLTMTMDQGASSFFTTDGSTPSSSSTPYTGAINLGSNNIIKAISYLSGVPSTVATSYIQNDVNAKPVPRSGLQLWLKDFGILTSGSNVTDWIDLSGSGKNATQATGANQPTYVSLGINDIPSVSFDGNNDYMGLASGFGPNLTTGVSIFAVIKPVGTGTATLLTSGNAGPSNQVSVQTLNTQAQFDAYNSTTASSVTSPTSSLTVGKFQSLGVVHSGSASASLTINSASVASGTVQNLVNITRTISYVGADNSLGAFWNGELAELLVWSRGLTTEETAAVGAYLLSRYQLSTAQTTPPSVLSVATGSFDGPTQVAIAADSDSVVKITTDGSTPTSSSTTYSQPINVIYTQTVKSIAIRNGIESSVVSVTLTLNSTKFPAPDPGDSRPLNLNLQLPTVAIPQ